MKVLVTGASGYIGQRLLPHLLNNGHQIVCLVRDPRRFPEHYSANENVKLLKGDLLDEKSLTKIPEDIEIAYFFVHSMGAAKSDFSVLESKIASNFIEALGRTNVRQIIYLSGIISREEVLSKHLSSRLNVENILKSGNINTTILRAAIIIGSGSGSFEIIRDLAEKLPIMITPKWLKTRCQPIAVRNVIDYLLGVLNNKETFNRIFDIGGPDILTYKEMLQGYADVRKLKRYIVTVPVLTPRLSSYWLYFVTSTNFALAKSLVDSMKTEVICGNQEIRDIVPADLISYKDSIKLAFNVIGSNRVQSSWIDSAIAGTLTDNFLDKIEVPRFGCLIDERKMKYDIDHGTIITKIFQIGGENGWYSWNWAWAVRGFIDKLFGGVGLRRGRRSPTELRAGDALDWWRVVFADKSEGKLILYAEMKVPGEAWLELSANQKSRLFIQKATFRPNGILGRIYWYALLPIHKMIFAGMARKIISENKI